MAVLPVVVVQMVDLPVVVVQMVDLPVAVVHTIVLLVSVVQMAVLPVVGFAVVERWQSFRHSSHSICSPLGLRYRIQDI